MTNPITPPPELVQLWLGTYFGTTVTGEVSGVELALATQAAQWGADQELEACCKWLDEKAVFGATALRTARRPKPPSLKKQALKQLRDMDQAGALDCNTDKIRAALEALPND